MQTILAVCVGKAVNHGLWLGRNTGTGAEEETANGFSDGVLARLLRWLCAHCPKSPNKGLQTNQSKWKVSALSSSLHTIQQSPPLTPPPPSNISKEKWVQWRIQPAPKSLTAPMFGGAHLHFSKLLTERSYLHLSPAQFQWNLEN